jgi:hypothetical protein
MTFKNAMSAKHFVKMSETVQILKAGQTETKDVQTHKHRADPMLILFSYEKLR